MVALAAAVVTTGVAAGSSPARTARQSVFTRAACVSFRPLGRPNGHNVYLDPGHGGIDPGAHGRTKTGRLVAEKQLTLAVALKALSVLRDDGFAVTLSRVTDTTVAPVQSVDRNAGALSEAADQRELRARIDCANAVHAQLFIGIHFDAAFERSVGGAETIYSRARRFASDNFRLARLVQRAVVDQLRDGGWNIPDRGVKADAHQGRSGLSAWERRYGHLLELGPPFPPRFREPTRMPGVIVEPLFISNPQEAAIAASERGQTALARAVAAAIETYFDVPKPPTPTNIDPLQGNPPRALVGKIPTTFPTRARVIALTFDAGGDDGGLSKIVSTLRRLHVPATFFLTGHFAQSYPRWTRRLAAAYPIGNHTMNHLDLPSLSDARVRAEVVGAAQTIRRITGRAPQPLFRFPYGVTSRRTLRIVNALGYAAVGWSVDTGGWLGPSQGQSVGGVVQRALAGLRTGEIILMHAGANPNDRSTLDADALPTIIHAARSRGYGFTTLPEAYASAFPRWASGGRRLQSRSDSALADQQALERFIRRGLPLYCGGARRRVVALTFDDGPGPATTHALDLLHRYGASATFFLIGENLREWPQLPPAEASLGAVGDHTWTHPFLTRLTAAAVHREIALTQVALQRATGAPITLFRPPYGFHDATVDRDVRRLGMLQVLWSLDSRDSYPPPGATAAQIVHTMKTSLHPGSIVLLHENLRETERALPSVLQLLRRKHLQSVSVPDLLVLDPPTLAQLRARIRGCPGANA